MAVAEVFVTMRDTEGDGHEQNVIFFVPDNDTLAHYSAFYAAAADVVDDVSGSQVVGGGIILPFTPPGSGIKTSPTAGYFNERGANILMDVSGSDFNESIRIPAILSTKLAGRFVNLSDTQVTNLISFMVAGDGVVIPKTRFGLDFIGTGIRGTKSFRKK